METALKRLSGRPTHLLKPDLSACVVLDEPRVCAVGYWFRWVVAIQEELRDGEVIRNAGQSFAKGIELCHIEGIGWCRSRESSLCWILG